MIFYIIIFLLIIVFLIINLIGKNYQNPYKLIMIFGKKGSGKTTYFTKISLNCLRKGIKCYSTVPIFGSVLFDVNDIGFKQFEPESVILIDEVGTIWDNRNFKNFKTEVRDFFKYQRHYRLTVYLASQTFDIDKKLRDLTDEMYLLECFSNIFSLAKKINKKITIHNSDDENSESFLTESYAFSWIFDWRLTFIPRYKYFFDSYEVKELPPVQTSIIKWNNISFLNKLVNNSYYYKYSFEFFCDNTRNEIITKIESVRDSLSSRSITIPDVQVSRTMNLL